MRSEGFHRTGDQCRQKIKGLRQKYKKITDNNKKSGRGRKTCKYYDRLNDIPGHRPASVPHHLVAIGAAIYSPSPGPSTRPDSQNPTPVDSDEGTSHTDEARPCTPAPSTSVDDLSGEYSANDHEDQESSDVSFGNRSTSKPGKRRKTRVYQFQKCMEETFEKFTESQKTNLKLFIENENKEMALEKEMEGRNGMGGTEKERGERGRREETKRREGSE